MPISSLSWVISTGPQTSETKKAPQKSDKTVHGVLYGVWKREEVSGFFKGLQAQILKTALSSALLLMIKEKIAASTWEDNYRAQVQLLSLKFDCRNKGVIGPHLIMAPKAVLPNRVNEFSTCAPSVAAAPTKQELELSFPVKFHCHP
ncbi:hypothetical protein VitviT2T_005309 [Vitis vinifera]|uniref:Uncharacterized protein n=1 Tax=Vitis vinifera TaxID=29760 RepID=A0ABY9BSI8_VITVI|nr:hypothetical protein VitviT2T_005309 [Vitis vinifera]